MKGVILCHAAKASSAEKQKGTPGNVDVDSDFVDLGKLRRASVSEFKGRKLLNIREYYEKDGEVTHHMKDSMFFLKQRDHPIARSLSLEGHKIAIQPTLQHWDALISCASDLPVIFSEPNIMINLPVDFH